MRVSYDRSGRERSQNEQHEDNERACARWGIKLGAPYREAGSKSASRYARKARDDFARLLEDLSAGRFGASVLVVWESSRGSRKVGEWVTLIELCEEHGVTIFVTTHEREYDPSNARDRRSLLEDAVDSEYESSKISARARRASAANAAAGRPHGPCGFGFVRRYDERTRQLIAQEPHPDEAPLIRELFDRLKSGHSLRSIALDWQERGVVNDSGRPFSASHLRTLALTPAYAGIRVHDPQGRRTGRRAPRLQPGVEQVEAMWPALVSKADFLAVQQFLTDPKRRTSRPGRAKHLLSLIAKCDVCRGFVSITMRRKESGEYQCNHGHVRCDKAELEKIAEAAVLEYLAKPDVHPNLARDEAADAELARVCQDLDAVRAELDLLRQEVATGRLSVAFGVAAEPQMLARISELETRKRELTTPSALHALITPGVDVRDRWLEMPMSARREVMRLLLRPNAVGELRVARRPPGSGSRRVPVIERVRWYTDDEPGQAA